MEKRSGFAGSFFCNEKTLRVIIKSLRLYSVSLFVVFCFSFSRFFPLFRFSFLSFCSSYFRYFHLFRFALPIFRFPFPSFCSSYFRYFYLFRFSSSLFRFFLCFFLFSTFFVASPPFLPFFFSSFFSFSFSCIFLRLVLSVWKNPLSEQKRRSGNCLIKSKGVFLWTCI